MKRLAPALGALLTVSLAATAARHDEPFPPRGGFVNSVHRFFPDLDARLNAVRYGRWRAIEIAWTKGIAADLDRAYSRTLLELLADPPRFPPEAERLAPRFAREAAPVFHALHWAQVFEQQALDVLATSDASAQVTPERLQRILGLYRREPWALAEPDAPAVESRAVELAPESASIFFKGARLFVSAAEDLAASNFGDQRWRVKQTVADFDRAVSSPAGEVRPTYRALAPTIAERYPDIADHLDRIGRFRGEVFDALTVGGQTQEMRRERDERVIALARRYGIPTQGIGGR